MVEDNFIQADQVVYSFCFTREDEILLGVTTCTLEASKWSLVPVAEVGKVPNLVWCEIALGISMAYWEICDTCIWVSL